MKNYFYELPIEIQNYIYDINKYQAIVKARYAIYKKNQFIMNLINDLNLENNYILYSATSSICPFSPYNIRILKLINNIVNEKFIENIFKKKSCISFKKWNSFLWCLQTGLWENEYSLNITGNYNITETIYHIFLAKTYKQYSNKTFEEYSNIPTILNDMLFDSIYNNL